MIFQPKKVQRSKSGFLLVELLVALFIFSVVATVSVGSIIGILDANKKTQALKTVMNNLNLALDSITRNAAVGYDYHCEFDGGVGSDFVRQDCSGADGSTEGIRFSFTSAYNLDEDPEPDTIAYALGEDSNGGYINRVIDNRDSGVRITAPEVNIVRMRFLVTGSDADDTEQPKVLMFVEGKINTGTRTETDFKVQTLVSQRLPDIAGLESI